MLARAHVRTTLRGRAHVREGTTLMGSAHRSIGPHIGARRPKTQYPGGLNTVPGRPKTQYPGGLKHSVREGPGGLKHSVREGPGGLKYSTQEVSRRPQIQYPGGVQGVLNTGSQEVSREY